jgi:hypothetical protein
MSKSIVAIDVGFGNTKTVWASLGQAGYSPDKEICFSSVTPACHLPHLEKTGGGVGSSLDRVVVEVDGRHYYVGPESSLTDGVRVLDPNFIERPWAKPAVSGCSGKARRARLRRLDPALAPPNIPGSLETERSKGPFTASTMGKAKKRDKPMSFKSFKEHAAKLLMQEIGRVAPELGKTEVFWIGIAAACTGWVLMHIFTGKLTSGYWAYGLALMIVGCAASLLLYPPKGEK